jgi:hypothetical protein
MSEVESNDAFIQVEKMSVDQLAGAFVMIAGAIGSLLLVIWQSKCHCKMNLCYIFSCERRPPNEEEMKSLKQQAKDIKKKTDKMSKKEDKILQKEDSILDEVESQKSLSRSNSKVELETINLDSPNAKP